MENANRKWEHPSARSDWKWDGTWGGRAWDTEASNVPRRYCTYDAYHHMPPKVEGGVISFLAGDLRIMDPQEVQRHRDGLPVYSSPCIRNGVYAKMPEGEPEPSIRYNFSIDGAKMLGSYCLGELIGHELAVKKCRCS